MTNPADQPRLERGALSFAEVLITGLSQIAPAFGVMFTAGLIAGYVGAGVPLIYLLAMLGIGATGMALAQFSRLWPSAGSFVTYVSRAISPTVGLAVATIALIGYTVGNGGVFVFVGDYIVTTVLETSGTGLTLAVTAGYAVLIAIPVIVGVRVGVRAAIAMYLFEVSVILILTVAILVSGGDHGINTEPLSLSHVSGKGIALAMTLGILAFVGFEAPAPLGEESKNPRRTVPLAILTGVLITGALYFAASFALVNAFPNADKLAADSAPFVTASNEFAEPLAGIVEVLLLTSVTGSYLGATTALARVFFSGAREGLWSRHLARLHPRFRTPWLAVCLSVGGSATIGIVVAALTDIPTASGFVPSLGILGIATMFIAVNAAAIIYWFRRRAAGERLSFWVWVATPCVGMAVLVLPYYSNFQPGQAPPFSEMPYWFGAMVAVGLAYTAYLRLRRPELVSQAGSLIVGERVVDANDLEREADLATTGPRLG